MSGQDVSEESSTLRTENRNEDMPNANRPTGCRKRFCGVFMRLLLPTVLIAAAAYIIQLRGWRLVYHPEFQLPGQGEMLFYAYDVNRDGFIDKLEFQFLAEKLDANVSGSV